MHKLYTVIFATLVVLQQAINPIQIPIATAQAQASTTKTNYQLNLNTTQQTAIELKDTRSTFDNAVLAPLKAAQETQAKAKAEAEARTQATSVVTALTVVAPIGDVKSLAYQIVCSRVGCAEWSAFEAIIAHESGWNPNAVNPSSGACGLPQALPCSKLGSMAVENQINWALGYMIGRYGSPSGALAFWNAHRWY